MSVNLSYSTAMLISLRLRSYASDRCLIFKDTERAEYTIMNLTLKGILVTDKG